MTPKQYIVPTVKSNGTITLHVTFCCFILWTKLFVSQFHNLWHSHWILQLAVVVWKGGILKMLVKSIFSKVNTSYNVRYNSLDYSLRKSGIILFLETTTPLVILSCFLRYIITQFVKVFSTCSKHLNSNFYHIFVVKVIGYKITSITHYSWVQLQIRSIPRTGNSTCSGFSRFFYCILCAYCQTLNKLLPQVNNSFLSSFFVEPFFLIRSTTALPEFWISLSVLSMLVWSSDEHNFVSISETLLSNSLEAW